MESTRFYEKLNKVEGKVYVIEEEVKMPENGIYEAFLQHDNAMVSTLNVYTGPKLTGERIQTFVLSTPSLTPWKQVIRIQTEKPVVYITYETDGDTVEADDINGLQSSVTEIQENFIVHAGSRNNPHGVTAAQIGLGRVENKNGAEIRSEMSREEIVAALGYTPAENESSYVHPDSGVTAGTYRCVDVDEKGHVTGGSNPTTLAGYGITDAAQQNHNHDGEYLKKGAMTWSDLGGG